MSPYTKMAVIIAAAILIASAANIYFSPFQTCKRELRQMGNENAGLECAVRTR